MSSSISSNMSARVWIMLLALSVLWGGSYFFIGVAVSELPPLTIIAIRVTLAAVTLWIISFAIGLRPPKSVKTWGAFLVMGTINNVIPFSLIVWGQTHIASGLASILNATTPLFTVIIAGVLLQDERITAKKGVGVIVGFFGVVLMIGPSALKGLGADTIAQVAMLGAAISYAFAGVYGRRFKEMGINPVLTAAGQVTASSIIMMPIAVTIDHPFLSPLPSFKIWVAIVGLAIMSTALAYILYFRILASAGATNLLLVTFLIPVSAILLGAFVLNERLDLVHFVGMFFISIGLSLIDGRLWSRRK